MSENQADIRLANLADWDSVSEACAMAREEGVRSRDAEVAILRACIEVMAGSVRNAIAKFDDAPMSAWAHLEEALQASEFVVGTCDGEHYSKEAISLRFHLMAKGGA